MRTKEVHTVSATFDSKDAAEGAVAALVQRSVPSDAIEVTLIDDSGLHPRGSVHRRLAWWRSMKIGVTVGAVLGGALSALLATSSLPSPAWVAGLLPSNTLLAIVVGMLTGAGLIGPSAAILTIGHSRPVVRVSEGESRRGMVAVSVRGEEVAETAREVLREVGAGRVSG